MLANRKHILPPITFVLFLFFFLGVLYNFVTPLWNPPDEERHFAYCEYIAQNYRLPVYRPDYEVNMVSMAFHPPLYYIIGALLIKNDSGLLEEQIDINDGPGFNRMVPPQNRDDSAYSGKVRSAYLLRLFSLIISGGTIFLIYRTALMLFPDAAAIASLVALLVATIPQFLYTSASISNENLNTMLSSAYLLALLYVLRAPYQIRYQVMSGFILGLCLLSKTTAIMYLPVTVCLICWLSFKEKRNPIAPLGIIIGTALLIGGWWYLRNWLLLNDPTLSKTVAALNYWHIRSSNPSWSEVIKIAHKTVVTFFGGFGSPPLSIAGYHVAFYGIIIITGCIGFFRYLYGRQQNAFQTQVLVLFLLSILGGLGIYVYINIKYLGFFLGRYLYIVMAPLAIATGSGFYFALPQWMRPGVLRVVCFLAIIMNVIVVLTILKPAYADPLLAVGIDQQRFCCSTSAISGSTPIGQTFIASHNKLCSIRVMFSCNNKNPSENIQFSLKECGSDKKILYQIQYPLRYIEDNKRYFFVFPPIVNSLGKKYVFSFSVPSTISDSGVSLFYEAANGDEDGEMLINDAMVPGDLYFTTYYFRGDVPQTDWQGIRATVIRQGWYITIPELQLYYERAKDFRLKTTTHNKMLQLGKALERRMTPSSKQE
jgi:4-amino-4-deoxy-L-arabinose transferase-like glycosyltransferase